MSPRNRPTDSDTNPAVQQPGILSKSGLDITLENIDKHLASIDEKLAASPTMAHYQALREDIDSLKGDLDMARSQHTEEVKSIKDRHAKDLKDLEEKYADKKSFDLVQKIVFGAVGLILITVVGGLLALVINTKGG